MKDKMKSENVDAIYRDIPLEKIPWNIESPPPELVDMVESGSLQPGRAVDLGCGLGNYTTWLAQQGFDAVGLDGSPNAIRIAKERAKEKKIDCRFFVADLTSPLEQTFDPFDFALEWSLLHHIHPEQRAQYMKNVASLLTKGGRYLSVCFNESDPYFGGKEKFRRTPIGTVLYFSNLDELHSLYKPHFEILESKIIHSPGKAEKPHAFCWSLLRK